MNDTDGPNLPAGDAAPAAAPARMATLLAAITDGLIAFDRDWRVTYANAEAERLLLGTGAASPLLGRSLWAHVPALRDSAIEAACRRARADDVPADFAAPLVPGGPWLEGRAYPAGDGLTVYFRDVTERKEREERLLAREREARAGAEAASRTKDEFLAVLSHELRTPLNAILGWAKILRTARLPADEVGRALETIERNARIQAQFIDDLLDVSRAITGRLVLEAAPVDVGAVVAEAVESVRTTAEAKRVGLETRLVRGLHVLGDVARLQQVVWNLVSNGIKFTPAGGRVQVLLRRARAFVEIEVSDTGVGISPELLPHVFERFRQADATTTRRHGGLGVGLAIVRHLVELHSGTVAARSGGPGQGATFVVRLPLATQPEAGAVSAAATDGAVSLAGVRVLVVDDDVDGRDLVNTVLTGSGARVITAGSASEAVPLVASGACDVIVSDIAMPGVDGYAFVRRLRADALAADVPALALTAHARGEDRAAALAAGFTAFATKPVDAPALIAAVARLAARRRAAV